MHKNGSVRGVHISAQVEGGHLPSDGIETRA